MGDIRLSPQRMSELFSFIREREGDVNHFYCDDNGLVTIGAGYLVDSINGITPQQLSQTISNLITAHGITFLHRNTSAQATLQNIIDDWNRVKQAYTPTRPQNAGFYRTIAQLYITSQSINTLLERKINTYINELYSERPFAISLPERIQMAIIDVRYNPAGVSLYSTSDAEIVNFWNALNPSSPSYNLFRALTIFRQIWRNRGNARYQRRHFGRIVWFSTAVPDRGVLRLSSDLPSFAESYFGTSDVSDAPRGITRAIQDDRRGLLSRGTTERGTSRW